MALVRDLRKQSGFDAFRAGLKGAFARVGGDAGWPHGGRDVRIARSGASKLPPILINTMPKSGSIYLTRTVATSLGIEFSLSPVASGVFPTYDMMPAALDRFRRGDVVRQEHFDGSPGNLAICRHYVDRIVLHVRDPRQATLSWAHHVNRLVGLNPHGPSGTVHQPPEDFCRWPFQRQIDWHIDRHLVSLVAWLRQWIGAEQTSPLKIRWTRFDELVTDERALFERILAFHDIPMDGVELRPPAKTIAYHYRCGRTNEWKEVFTAKQKARCRAIIGDDILDHFGWSADDID